MDQRPRHRFDFDAAEEWKPRYSGAERKFGKTQESIVRQRINGADIDDVRAKVVRLHRMSTAFDGNGSTLKLKQKLGLAPRPPEYSPPKRTAADHYESHVDDPAALPGAKKARMEMQRLREERLAARPRTEYSRIAEAEDRFDELEAELAKRYTRYRML